MKKAYEMKKKEDALDEFVDMVRKSWTFGRLTTAERDKLWEAFEFAARHLRGNFDARWATLQTVYNAFLLGVGYTDFNWRDVKEAEAV